MSRFSLSNRLLNYLQKQGGTCLKNTILHNFGLPVEAINLAIDLLTAQELLTVSSTRPIALTLTEKGRQEKPIGSQPEAIDFHVSYYKGRCLKFERHFKILKSLLQKMSVVVDVDNLCDENLDTISLMEENEQLENENAKLRKELERLQHEHTSTRNT